MSVPKDVTIVVTVVEHGEAVVRQVVRMDKGQFSKLTQSILAIEEENRREGRDRAVVAP